MAARAEFVEVMGLQGKGILRFPIGAWFLPLKHARLNPSPVKRYRVPVVATETRAVQPQRLDK